MSGQGQAQARTTVKLVFGQFLYKGALAAYTVALARTLPVQDFGRFAFSVALLGIVAALADGGFARLIVRETARSTLNVRRAANLLLARGTFSVAVFAVAGVAAASGLFPFGTYFAALALGYLIAESLAMGFDSVCIGTDRTTRLVASQAAGATALLSWTIWTAIASQTSPEAAIAGVTVAAAVRLVIHVTASGWLLVPSRLSELPMASWLRQTLPFLALGLLATVYYRLGIIALAVRGDAEDIAAFAAAFRVVEATGLVGAAVFSAASPALSRDHRNAPASIFPDWKRSMCLGAFAVTPVVVVLTVAAPEICELLFGEAYRDSAGECLRLLGPGVAFLLLQSRTAAIVFMADDHAHVIALTAINVALAGSATFVGVALWAAPGAAAAASFAEFVSFASFAAFVIRKYAGRDT